MSIKHVVSPVCLCVFILCGLVTVQAEILTIETEPPQLIQLRNAYESQKSRAVNPEQLNTLRQNYEAKKKAALDQIEQQYQQDLQKLQQSSVGAIHQQYVRDLQALEKTLINKSDLAGALVVQRERKNAMSSAPTAPAAAPAVAMPPALLPPAGAMTKTSPATYVSDVEGIAGSPGNTSNNIYTFNVGQTGKNTQVKYYAAGLRGRDTNGEIYLTGPDNKRREIAEWSPKTFKEYLFEVNSYKDMEAVDIDISKYVSAPGKYKVEFQYDGGDNALRIIRVELLTWN